MAAGAHGPLAARGCVRTRRTVTHGGAPLFVSAPPRRLHPHTPNLCRPASWMAPAWKQHRPGDATLTQHDAIAPWPFLTSMLY
jgi:hypothetical protein